MKKIHIITLLIAIAFLVSCATENFVLLKNSPDEIEGQIMGPIDSLEVTGQNAFSLYEKGACAVRCFGVTGFESQFDVKIISGEGVRISVRSAPYKFDVRPKISFEYKKSGSELFDCNTSLPLRSRCVASANNTTQIKILNYDKLFNIIVDCDTIYTGTSTIPASEYLIFESIGKSRIDFTGFSITEIYEPEAEYYSAKYSKYWPAQKK